MKKPDAKTIKERIEFSIQNTDLNDIDINQLGISEKNIKAVICAAFWNPQKRCIYTVHNNNLLMHSEKDAFKYLCETHGAMFNKNYFYKFAALQHLSHKDTSQIIRDCIAVHLMDHLKLHCQRSSIDMRVDMFAEHPRIEKKDELARIVFTHKPYITESVEDQEVVNDYKEHFPQLDEVLDFIVASRFARDRKKSYLWFKCSSDWGKGFLIGLLNSLDISVELSIKEIESMFEGKPVGRSMVDFKKSIVIVIDEFKTVKSELKQLQSEISLSPKNQLSFKVEIFAKLFFSAENVNSLVGEHGVEDQFINRFNFLNLSGELTQRKLFIKIGSGAYFDGVQPYITRYLNQAIDEKIKSGKKKAEFEAENYLRNFMNKYGLEQSYSRLSKGLKDIAGDIAKTIDRQCNVSGEFDIVRTENGLFLKKPAKYIENYIDENFSYSDKSTITKKRDEIMGLISTDGKGCYSHRIEKYKPVKAILIDPALLKDE